MPRPGLAYDMTVAGRNIQRHKATEIFFEREDYVVMEKNGWFFSNVFSGFQKSGSTMRIEILAGVTTFITIAYILILNPQILADPYMIMGDGAMAEKNFQMVYLSEPVSAHLLVRFYVRYMQRFHLPRRLVWD